VIQHVDRALERLFRQIGAVDESVEISFDAPDRGWGAARVRPTVDLFLWEVVRNPAAQSLTLEQRVEQGRPVLRRPSNPVVDLHYLVTAWASERSDEHRLLGSLLRTILATAELPAEVLPEALAETRCGIALAPYDKRVPGEFWSALDGQPKPGLQLEVSLPFEVFDWSEAAPVARSVAASVVAVPAPADEQAGALGRDRSVALRRRRASGSIVMEGRPDPTGEPSEPAGARRLHERERR
jgi:hypothetical protein